ncbi:MAG: SMP-30/gluconolactonase/LRE family protein [Alphaproteobacteria bacterium]|nr:SMP-30/gluconolactonase/LRE family protein [Alphaproteobacteria bacterium]
MLKGDIRLLIGARAKVTECPLWDGATRRLHVVDIYAGAILTHDWASGRTASVTLGGPVGSIGLARSGCLVAGLEAGVAIVDPATGTLERVAEIPHARPEMRLNDGRCDPAGRFWVGSMREALDEPAGALYRVDPDGHVLRHAGDIICSNGLAWSPDGRTMYHADSRRRTVWRYDYDPATGSASNRRVFCVAREGEGRPDGAAVDAEGCYWSARYAGWRIVRHAPDGSELFTLRTPVENPTMCAFAGDDLSTLVITSARGSLTDDQLRAQPEAGSVFAVDVAVPGLPEPRFGA